MLKANANADAISNGNTSANANATLDVLRLRRSCKQLKLDSPVCHSRLEFDANANV